MDRPAPDHLALLLLIGYWLWLAVAAADAQCVPYARLVPAPNATPPAQIPCAAVQDLFYTPNTARLAEAPLPQLHYYWGLLVFHDIGLDVPGAQWAAYAPAGLQGQAGVCSAATPALDASFLYGSTPAVTAALRTRWRGQMNLSVVGELSTACGPDVPRFAPPWTTPARMPCAGDPRAAETLHLLALQTLLVMHHNAVCERLFRWDDTRTDDAYFAAARAVVVALFQRITFEEWLPALLGSSHPIPRYRAPAPGAPPPSLLAEFQFAVPALLAATAADDVLFSDQNQELTRIPLLDGVFNPPEMHRVLGGADGVCTVATGLLRAPLRAVAAAAPRTFLDMRVPEFACAAARNASVPTVAQLFPDVVAPQNLTASPQTLAALRAAYAPADDAAIAAALDLPLALALEDHGPASDDILGPHTRALVVAQLVARTRDPDPLWYEAVLPRLSRRERKLVQRTSLAIILAQRCAALAALDGPAAFSVWAVSDVTIVQQTNSNLDTPNRNTVIGMLVVVAAIFVVLLALWFRAIL